MELTCPSVIWKISPFNSTNRCVTKCFEFLNCDWRWEYSVRTKRDNEEEIVSVYLRRLTNSSACPLKKVSTIVSIKGSNGEHHAAKASSQEISPQASWCVWQQPKSFILLHNVVRNNGCVYSLTLEPCNSSDDLNSLSTDESYDTSCLQELSRDLDKFLKCSRHADIILKCKNTEIKAHKDVLCLRSKKLADMIENDDIQDTSMENLKKIVLSDMDPVVFVILLRFIYTSSLPDLTNELAKKMYVAADEYCIDSLKRKSAQFMIQHFCNLDVIEMLVFADERNDDYLKWAASSHIVSDLNILQSKEWKNFSKTNQKLAVDVFKIFAERVNNRTYSKVPLA